MSNLSLSRKLGRYPPPHGIFAEKEARDEIDLRTSRSLAPPPIARRNSHEQNKNINPRPSQEFVAVDKMCVQN